MPNHPNASSILLNALHFPCKFTEKKKKRWNNGIKYEELKNDSKSQL